MSENIVSGAVSPNKDILPETPAFWRRPDLAILFLAFLFLYSFSPTILSADSLSYLSDISRPLLRFHPHHLTYMASMQILARLANVIGLTDQPWFVAHVVMLIMSAAGLVFAAWFFEALGCAKKLLYLRPLY